MKKHTGLKHRKVKPKKLPIPASLVSITRDFDKAVREFKKGNR